MGVYLCGQVHADLAELSETGGGVDSQHPFAFVSQEKGLSCQLYREYFRALGLERVS